MRRTRLALLAAAMLAHLLAACVPAVPGRGAAGCPARKAILLAGYDTGTNSIGPNSVKHTFEDIVPALGSLHYPGGPTVYARGPVYFSYRGPGTSYTTQDTHDALSNGSGVGALHATVVDVLKGCPQASLDLIGHSLGGVVAWEYVVQYGHTDEGRHIAHVITLDSPVNGLSKWPGVLGALSPTAEFLLYTHDLKPATTNIDVAVGLSPHMVIRTFASEQDQIVLPADALIAKARFQQAVSLAQTCPSPDSVVGLLCLHGQILQDAGVRQAIMDTLLLSPSGTSPSPESASLQPSIRAVPLLPSSAPTASQPSAAPSGSPQPTSSSAAPSVSPPSAPLATGASPSAPNPAVGWTVLAGWPGLDGFATDPDWVGPKGEQPKGVAVDGQGNVYVADAGNNRIQKLSGEGQPLGQWGAKGTAPGQFNQPGGLSVDGGSSIYVADTANNRIQKLSDGGQPVAEWGSAGTGPGQFNQPQGVAVDGQGSVYVADTGNNRIQKLSATGQPLAQWGSKGTGPGQFDQPAGIALDAQGNVYVGDTGNHSIQKLSAAGQPLAQWLLEGLVGVPRPDASAPRGLAVDGQGNVYVAETSTGEIRKLSPAGRLLWRTVLARGPGAGPAPRAESVAVDGQGNIYVAGTFVEYGVGKLSPNGGSLARPSGVAVDAHGNLYVADPGFHFPNGVWRSGCVEKLPSSGGLLDVCPARASSSEAADRYQFDPGSVALDAQENVYVTGAGCCAHVIDKPVTPPIAKLSPTGQLLAQWVSGDGGGGGIGVDSQGNVYVSDVFFDRIMKLSASGQPLAQWGPGSRAKGRPPLLGVIVPQFAGLAVDGQDHIYVADAGNDRIQKLSSNLQPLAQWGQKGNGPGQFNGPAGVAVDGQGNVYVADAGNNRIQKLSPSGEPLAQWGSKGYVPGRFNRPSAVAVDGQGNIYVADSGNHRIQKLMVT